MPGQSELLQVRAHRLRRDPLLAQVLDRRHAVVPLRELPAVRPENEAVMDVLRRLAPECLVQPAVECLVGAVVRAANDVSDPELDVVDDAREVVGGCAVLTHERDPLEAVAERATGLEVLLAAVALTDRPLVPDDPEPLEVAYELLLPAGKVAPRIGVVDPEQEPVATAPVRHRGEGTAEMKRARRARGEADARRHPRESTSDPPAGSGADGASSRRRTGSRGPSHRPRSAG